MPGQSTKGSAPSPGASRSGRKSEPQSKLQRPPQPQDQGTDQLSRNKEAQDVTNQILALADERAYLLAMPKPSNETKAGFIAGLDNINFLNEILAKKDAADEALESEARKMSKKMRAQNSKFEKLLAESKALQNTTDRKLGEANELLKWKVEYLERKLEKGPSRGKDMWMKGLLVVATIMLFTVSTLLRYVTQSECFVC